jgi:hypothetical protein
MVNHIIPIYQHQVTSLFILLNLVVLFSGIVNLRIFPFFKSHSEVSSNLMMIHCSFEMLSDLMHYVLFKFTIVYNITYW